MGQRAAALGGPVAGCQGGCRRSGARLRRPVLAVWGRRKDESAEDAGPQEAQVTKLGFGAAAAERLPRLVLHGDNRGDCEPRLLAAGLLPDLQLPGEDVWSSGSTVKLRAFGPQDFWGPG